MREHSTRIRPFALALLFGLVSVMVGVGCSDMGDPPAKPTVPIEELCAHFIPSGWVLENGALRVADEFHRDVRGDLELPTTSSVEDLHVAWVDFDSVLIVPPGDVCTNHRLLWSMADSSVAKAERRTDDKWGFRLRALRDGTTILRFRPVHRDGEIEHTHYASADVVVRVGTGGAGFAFTGFEMHAGTALVASQRNTAVTGSVAVGANEATERIDVTWLEANGKPIEASALKAGSSLQVDVVDDDRAQVESLGPWSFRLIGLSEGATTLRLSIERNGARDFGSAAVALQVGPGHSSLGVEGLRIDRNCTLFATYGFNDTDLVTASTGALRVRPGQRDGLYRTSFLGAWDAGEEHRVTVTPSDPKYALRFEVQDSSVARLEVGPEPFSFEIIGQRAGVTEARLVLVYDGVAEFRSGPIPIRVEADPAQVRDFLFKRNGIWNVIYRGGSFGDACGQTAAPGYFEVRVGETSEHFVFRFIDAYCSQVDPGEEGRELVCEFDGGCVAKALSYPEHGHTGLGFHLYGIAEGEASVRVRLVHEGVTEYVTPPIRVVVLAR